MNSFQFVLISSSIYVDYIADLRVYDILSKQDFVMQKKSLFYFIISFSTKKKISKEKYFGTNHVYTSSWSIVSSCPSLP